MIPIKDVIAVYETRLLDNDTKQARTKLKEAKEVRDCWFTVHAVTESDDDDYPEVVHTHGLLYRYPNEIEVNLSSLPIEEREGATSAFIQAMNEAVRNGNTPNDYIVNNKHFDVVIGERRMEDDGLLMYDDERYITQVYNMTKLTLK